MSSPVRRSLFSFGLVACLACLARVVCAAPTAGEFCAAAPNDRAITLLGAWRFAPDNSVRTGVGVEQRWYESGFDDSGWRAMAVGQSWEKQGLNYDGVAWFRARVFIPGEWRGQKLGFSLGLPDDHAVVYLNGAQVWKATAFGPRIRFTALPADLRFGDWNTLAIRVTDFYKEGGIHGSDFAVERVLPFGATPAGAAPARLALSLTAKLPDDPFADSAFRHGRRDGGTADTRPRLAAARGAFTHPFTRAAGDALCVEAWYPNSAGETVDYRLLPAEGGDTWQRERFDYVSFYVRSADTAGEMNLGLNVGDVRWGTGGSSPGAVSYSATFPVTQTSVWQRVVLPFTAFRRKLDNKTEPLESLAKIDTLAIGTSGGLLQRPGTIQFAAFEVGRCTLPAAAEPVALDGLWRFRLDDRKPDGTPVDKKDEAEKDGFGLQMGFEQPAFNDADWDLIHPGKAWELQGHPGYNGCAWYRQNIVIPAAWRGRPLGLQLGRPDDRGEVYWNGAQVANIEKFGPSFDMALAPDAVRYGQTNTVAVRIHDWFSNGGLIGGPFRIGPAPVRLFVARAGGVAVPPESFDPGVTPPATPWSLRLEFLPGVADRPLALSATLRSCFHRDVVSITVPLPAHAPAADIPLTPDQTRQLYYSENFAFTCVLTDPATGDVVWAGSEPSRAFALAARDTAALPALPETTEETPVGRLRLIDRIDCSVDPATDIHPYKEGGIRASWVGRRAYHTWERGVTVESLADRPYRQAANNEFFGYRIGRGSLKPHTAYLLRILYPEDHPRYFALDIKAGRNYQGTGFRTGTTLAAETGADPSDPWPLSGTFQWYDHIVIPDDVTYGQAGANTASGTNGFWLFFHDIGRAYAGAWSHGPAAAEIRLYAIDDAAACAPRIARPPAGVPRRLLMTDWERQPEIPPADAVLYARMLGLDAIAPVIQKWASAGFFHSSVGFTPPGWYRASPVGEDDADTYTRWLAATRGSGIGLIPRIEYGGGPKLPKDARVIGADGKIDPCGRFCSWGANLLHPATLQEVNATVDDLIGREIAANPQLGGVLWRMRQDRLKCSYGPADVALFCKETGATAPAKADAAALAKWASSTVAAAYHAWWHGKRRDFHAAVTAHLQAARPDLRLFYYNWDPDGWNLGLNNNAVNKPQDWTDYYDVAKAPAFLRRRALERAAFSDADYVRMVSTFGEPHLNFLAPLYAALPGFVAFAPVHRYYLANNGPYLEHFRSGDRLAVCNMFSYEEKARWNVQADNHESCEMTPGGPDFGMADEVLSVFHGDPQTLTWTTYTYGRGFIDAHRRFAQAFLALPAVAGVVVPQANPDIRVRRYDTAAGAYVAVVHRGLKPTQLDLAALFPGQALHDLVLAAPAPATLPLPPMSLQAFQAKQHVLQNKKEEED